MHHADERLNYKYVLIDVGTLNYVLNRFFEQVMIIGSVDTAVSIYGSFLVFHKLKHQNHGGNQTTICCAAF